MPLVCTSSNDLQTRLAARLTFCAESYLWWSPKQPPRATCRRAASRVQPTHHIAYNSNLLVNETINEFVQRQLPDARDLEDVFYRMTSFGGNEEQLYRLEADIPHERAGLLAELRDRHPHLHGLPRQARPVEYEARESVALEHILGRARAVVELAMIVHGVWARVHSDLYILICPIHMTSHVADDAKVHLNLVGDVLHQLLGIAHPHRSATIVFTADKDCPTVSVGKAADSPEILVTPAGLLTDIS